MQVILSFLKVGTIGFGGGAALIPVIEKELVENREWIDKEKFDTVVAVSSISPASLPVSLCTIWNTKFALLSAYLYALPGPLIYMILLTGFDVIGESGQKYIGFASVGLLAFVLLILYMFIRKNYARALESGIKIHFILIALAAFLLNGENAVIQLVGMLFSINNLPTPIFSIGMLDLLAMTFFVICFMGYSKSKIKFAISLLIAGFYALSSGRMGIFQELSLPLLVVMTILALSSIFTDFFKNKEKRKQNKIKIDYKPLRNILLFALFAGTLVTGVYIISQDENIWSFAFNGITSSLSSFGGGEVYYAISYETFVESGFISREFYYTRILGLAGAMPGPVIVSILSGVGFAYGSTYGIGMAWLFGFLGGSFAITATAFGALTLFTFFEIFKESNRLKMIVRYIMPVVCGILVSVALSLLTQASNVIVNVGVSMILAFAAVLALFGIMLFLRKKCNINDIILLLGGGGVSLLILSLII